MPTIPSLYLGARVALVCPSSPIEPQRLDSAVETVRTLGLEPVVYPSCLSGSRYSCFAADDAARAKDLQNAFSDPSIQGVWCMRGGYGAARLLPLLYWGDIARHPKVFCGYSDVTALHTALDQTCHMVTFHTPMPAAKSFHDVDEFTMSYLRRALFGALSGPLPLGADAVTLQPGQAKGALCGGNLSVLCRSLGTPWEIDTRGKLLFLEDVGEKTWRIDACLTQLRNAGKFDQCAGVLLGAWTDCTDDGDALELEQILRETVLPAGKPVLAGLPCGHCLPTMSLPLGATAELDAGQQTLTVLA